MRNNGAGLTACFLCFLRSDASLAAEVSGRLDDKQGWVGVYHKPVNKTKSMAPVLFFDCILDNLSLIHI